MTKCTGYLHLYEGDGKGKTTAAVGLCIRALGAGRRVGMASFLKDGSSSELAVLRTLERMTLFPVMRDVPFTWCMTREQTEEAKQFYRDLFDIIEKDCQSLDLLVLDEIVDAVNAGLIEEAWLIEWIKQRPEQLELILTGHGASPALCACADYHTVMSAKAHPYTNGTAARHGIEF